MQKDWLKGKLAPHIAVLPGAKDANGNDVMEEMIVLERFPDGSPMKAVPIDTFMAHFGHIPYVATAAKLKDEDKGKGYGRFFDQWKAEGLLD